MQFFDINSHIDLVLSSTPHDILIRAKKAGVANVMVSGLYPKQWCSLLILKRIGYHIAFGLHPLWADQFCESKILMQLNSYLQMYPLTPVGEIGLDARKGSPDFSQQKKVFVSQLEIAKDYGSPVIIHVVKSYGECLRILSKLNISHFVIHNFSGSLEIALEFLNLGGFLSVSGVATHKKSDRIRKILSRIPMSRLVLESNAPDLAPVNVIDHEPAKLLNVAESLSEIQESSLEDVARITTRNAFSLFKMC